MLKAVALGQGLSVLIAATGIFSNVLVRQGISLPAAQSVINYVALAVVYGAWMLHKRQRVKQKWYIFAALALSDVMANFCLILAYKYTTLTSVTLLDCFTIPSVLVLSWLFLGARYSRLHWVGAGICLSGLAVLVVTDSSYTTLEDAPNPSLGDGLVLVGALLYAVSNVAQEKLLDDVGRIEVLAMNGCFGAIFGTLLAAASESKAIANTHWGLKAILPFLGFNAALFAFSSLVPFVLIWGGAAVLNLSLLSSDVWVALARLLFFGGFTAAAAASFLAAFALVATGLIVYSAAGPIYFPSRASTEGSPRHDNQEAAFTRDLNGQNNSLHSQEEDVEAQKLLSRDSDLENLKVNEGVVEEAACGTDGNSTSSSFGIERT